MTHLAPVVPGPQPELQQRIVARLEEALAAARAGKYEGGLLCFELVEEAGLEWVVLGTRSSTQLLGRLEVLKFQILQEG